MHNNYNEFIRASSKCLFLTELAGVIAVVRMTAVGAERACDPDRSGVAPKQASTFTVNDRRSRMVNRRSRSLG